MGQSVTRPPEFEQKRVARLSNAMVYKTCKECVYCKSPFGRIWQWWKYVGVCVYKNRKVPVTKREDWELPCDGWTQKRSKPWKKN